MSVELLAGPFWLCHNKTEERGVRVRVLGAKTWHFLSFIAETNASRKMDKAACMQVEVECLAAEKQFLLSENRTLTNKNVRPLLS